MSHIHKTPSSRNEEGTLYGEAILSTENLSMNSSEIDIDNDRRRDGMGDDSPPNHITLDSNILLPNVMEQPRKFVLRPRFSPCPFNAGVQ
mmetsp:Transcript_26139/g.53527  ORF Transcript_26139/g.53527 Transcript_26139/m.53527 type:complete len:90 (+) Transcript_26139:117-386(+)